MSDLGQLLGLDPVPQDELDALLGIKQGAAPRAKDEPPIRTPRKPVGEQPVDMGEPFVSPLEAPVPGFEATGLTKGDVMTGAQFVARRAADVLQSGFVDPAYGLYQRGKEAANWLFGERPPDLSMIRAELPKGAAWHAAAPPEVRVEPGMRFSQAQNIGPVREPGEGEEAPSVKRVLEQAVGAPKGMLDRPMPTPALATLDRVGEEAAHLYGFFAGLSGKMIHSASQYLSNVGTVAGEMGLLGKVGQIAATKPRAMQFGAAWTAFGAEAYARTGSSEEARRALMHAPLFLVAGQLGNETTAALMRHLRRWQATFIGKGVLEGGVIFGAGSEAWSGALKGLGLDDRTLVEVAPVLTATWDLLYTLPKRRESAIARGDTAALTQIDADAKDAEARAMHGLERWAGSMTAIGLPPMFKGSIPDARRAEPYLFRRVLHDAVAQSSRAELGLEPIDPAVVDRLERSFRSPGFKPTGEEATGAVVNQAGAAGFLWDPATRELTRPGSESVEFLQPQAGESLRVRIGGEEVTDAMAAAAIGDVLARGHGAILRAGVIAGQFPGLTETAQPGVYSWDADEVAGLPKPGQIAVDSRGQIIVRVGNEETWRHASTYELVALAMRPGAPALDVAPLGDGEAAVLEKWSDAVLQSGASPRTQALWAMTAEWAMKAPGVGGKELVAAVMDPRVQQALAVDPDTTVEILASMPTSNAESLIAEVVRSAKPAPAQAEKSIKPADAPAVAPEAATPRKEVSQEVQQAKPAEAPKAEEAATSDLARELTLREQRLIELRSAEPPRGSSVAERDSIRVKIRELKEIAPGARSREQQGLLEGYESQLKQSIRGGKARSKWKQDVKDAEHGIKRLKEHIRFEEQRSKEEAETPVEEPTQVQGGQAPAPAQKPIKALPGPIEVITGKPSGIKVKTEQGSEVEVKYEIVELEDLVTSHDPTTFEPRPGYPGELQPRDRTRTKGQVGEMAARLDPERLGESVMAGEGAPIVGEGNVVESGNARTMALANASVEKQMEYAAWLEANAERFGIDPRTLGGMGMPVLVRRRVTEMTPEQRVQWTREANVSTVARMAPAEQAKVDADSMTDNLVKKLRTDADGDLLAGSNREFLDSWLGSLPKSERESLVDPGGDMNPAGLQRLRAAILWRAYQDPRLVAHAVELADPEFKRLVNTMVALAPEIVRLRAAQKAGTAPTEPRVIETLIDAMGKLGEWVRGGYDPGMELRQGQLFKEGEIPRPVALIAKELWERRRSGKAMIAFARDLLRPIAKGSGASQSQLYEIANPTLEEIVDMARGAPGDHVAYTGIFGANPTIGRLLWRATTLPVRLSRAILNFHSQWLIDRLERDGGPSAKQAAPILREVIDDARKLRGDMAPVIDPALHALGRSNEATEWLSTLDVDSSGKWGISNTRLAIEGKIAVPASAAPTVQLLLGANWKIGIVAERGNPEFVATGKMQRIPTFELIDAIRQPSGSAGRELVVEAFAEANPQLDPNPNVRHELVAALFDRIKADMDGGDWTAVERKISQEFTRKFEQVPSAVKDALGNWRWLYHDKGHDYVRNASERVAQRTAFLERFSPDEIKLMAADMKREIADKEMVEDFMRAMHGLPRDLGMMDPFKRAGTAAYTVNRFFADVMRPIALMTSIFPNTSELVLGNVPRQLGYLAYFEGWRRLYGDGGEAFRSMLEHMGATNAAIYDWSKDPQQSGMTLMRRFRQLLTVGSGNQFVNELQERLAAASAFVFAEQMQNGKLPQSIRAEKARMLEDAGFTEAEAKLMVEGLAEQAAYDRFVRGAASWLTGGNKALAESSRLQTSRLWSALFPFQSFPATQARHIIQPTIRILEANKRLRVAMKVGDVAERDKAIEDSRIANKQLARQLGFTTASGAVITLFQAFLSGGVQGIRILASEAGDRLENETLSFLSELFLNGLGGPFSMIWWALQRQPAEEGMWFQTAVETSFPGQFIAEILHAVPTVWGEGSGPYSGKTPLQTMSKWLQRNPLGRLAGLWSGSIGLGSMTISEKASVRAFWRWYEKYGGKKDRPMAGSYDAWRDHMEAAATKIKAGEDPTEDLSLAFDVSEELPWKERVQRIREGLRNRRLLPRVKDPELLERLRKRIGNSAYAVIEMHDAFLDDVARSVSGFIDR